jgi:hypothetical protein
LLSGSNAQGVRKPASAASESRYASMGEGSGRGCRSNAVGILQICARRGGSESRKKSGQRELRFGKCAHCCRKGTITRIVCRQPAFAGIARSRHTMMNTVFVEVTELRAAGGFLASRSHGAVAGPCEGQSWVGGKEARIQQQKCAEDQSHRPAPSFDCEFAVRPFASAIRGARSTILPAEVRKHRKLFPRIKIRRRGCRGARNRTGPRIDASDATLLDHFPRERNVVKYSIHDG